MAKMKRGDRQLNNRGFLLITSYMLLALLLVYSNALTMRTFTQQLANDQLRQRLQALDLAQGAAEQLKEDLYSFLVTNVYPFYGQRPDLALAWLETVPTGGSPMKFDIPITDTNGDGVLDTGDGASDGLPTNPRCLTGLPMIPSTATCNVTTQPVGAPRAWVSTVTRTGGSFDPRNVMIEADAQVGSVTRHIRLTYKFALGTSDIFSYAYFVNNKGWLSITNPNAWVTINGDVRANGDFTLESASTGPKISSCMRREFFGRRSKTVGGR